MTAASAVTTSTADTNRSNLGRLYTCDGCGSPALALATVQGHVSNYEENDQFQLVAVLERVSVDWSPPTRGHPVRDVPARIAAAAVEAQLCRSVKADRAAVILARAVVEAVAKDHEVEHGSLMAKIDALHDRGLLRSYTHAAAHEVRHLGNDMAHGDFGEAVDDCDAEDVLQVMNEVLEEVYAGPARIERMRTARTGRGRPS